MPTHTQQNGGGGTHRRALRNTQQVGGNQRVTENCLEGGARNGEGGTDEPGGEQARNAHGQQHVFGGLVDLQIHAEPVLAEDAEELVQFDRVPAGDE